MEENTEWKKTKVYSWLNINFLLETFSEEERAMLVNPYVAGADKSGEKEGYAFILSAKEYKTYQELVSMKKSNWWLREDAGLSSMGAEYVNSEGEVKKTYVNNASCYIRPAVWVKTE